MAAATENGGRKSEAWPSGDAEHGGGWLVAFLETWLVAGT